MQKTKVFCIDFSRYRMLHLVVIVVFARESVPHRISDEPPAVCRLSKVHRAGIGTVFGVKTHQRIQHNRAHGVGYKKPTSVFVHVCTRRRLTILDVLVKVAFSVESKCSPATSLLGKANGQQLAVVSGPKIVPYVIIPGEYIPEQGRARADFVHRLFKAEEIQRQLRGCARDILY